MNLWVVLRAPRRMCGYRRLGGQAPIPGGIKDIEKELLGVEKFLAGAREPSAMPGPVRELRSSLQAVPAFRMLTLKSLNSENRKVLYYEGVQAGKSVIPLIINSSDCPGGLVGGVGAPLLHGLLP